MNYIKKTLSAYEKEFERYRQKKEGSDSDMYQWLEEFAKRLKGNRVLEIGFGLGYDAKWFLDHDFEYTGVDPVSKFHESIKQKVTKNASLFQKDILETNFPSSSFDGIWATASLLHLSDGDLKIAIEKCHNWLKNDGLLFVSIKKGRKQFTTDDGRFFNLFSKSRFLEFTKKQFKLEYFSTDDPKSFNRISVDWLNFYLRKI